MLERMHKTGTGVLGCPQRTKTESEWYVGAQTSIWMVEDNVVEVPFDGEHLLEAILLPDNLNKAYKAVIRNKGCGGFDRMSCGRRIRMGIWKSWKKPKTRISNLIRCGIPKRKACEWSYTRLGYWHITDSWITHNSMTNERLRIAGYPTLYDEYLKWYPK